LRDALGERDAVGVTRAVGGEEAHVHQPHVEVVAFATVPGVAAIADRGHVPAVRRDRQQDRDNARADAPRETRLDVDDGDVAARQIEPAQTLFPRLPTSRGRRDPHVSAAAGGDEPIRAAGLLEARGEGDQVPVRRAELGDEPPAVRQPAHAFIAEAQGGGLLAREPRGAGLAVPEPDLGHTVPVREEGEPAAVRRPAGPPARAPRMGERARGWGSRALRMNRLLEGGQIGDVNLRAGKAGWRAGGED